MGSSREEEIVKTVFMLFHLVLAAGILLVGVVEFSVASTIFDVFGKSSEQRSLIPETVFKNGSISNKGLEHILDTPILALFLIYFLAVLWLKCRGVFAWLLTTCQLVGIFLFVAVNVGLAQIVLDWRYFSTRAVIIFLDVLILSFNWTVIIVTLLHIRGWFPFKASKKVRDIPYHKRTPMQRVLVVVWNFMALYLVLGLCFLVWFSKLYVSWACVRHRSEIKLMCQFTNLVQCWQCNSENNFCNQRNISQCILDEDAQDAQKSVIRCIQPLYTVNEFDSAFCVFNYNIGPFTFVAVFSYVGGIYFFMRTVLNALVKCLYNVLYVAIHCCFNVFQSYVKTSKDAEATSLNTDENKDDVLGKNSISQTDPRVSLLGPLPEFRNIMKHKKTGGKILH